MYIHERDNWTNFRWDASEVSLLQEKVFRMQGLLYGVSPSGESIPYAGLAIRQAEFVGF